VKLQADITRALSRLEELRMQRVDAEATLNELMDRPPETPIESITAFLSRIFRSISPGYTKPAVNPPDLRSALLQIERDEGRNLLPILWSAGTGAEPMAV
jgi:hypothetical protein